MRGPLLVAGWVFVALGALLLVPGVEVCANPASPAPGEAGNLASAIDDLLLHGSVAAGFGSALLGAFLLLAARRPRS